MRHLGPPADASEDSDRTIAELEDVELRAERLGVTIEKVLKEYANIAFADWRHIVDWDEKGLHLKKGIPKKDMAAIAEMSNAGGDGTVRVKLYDKKAALDAIARHLGMFTPPDRRHDEDGSGASVEDVREELARRLARLAGEDEAR